MFPLPQFEHGITETFNNLGTAVYNALLRLIMAPGIAAAAAVATAAAVTLPGITKSSEGGSNGSASTVLKSTLGEADSRDERQRNAQ
ncbi:hypothetical protein QFC21_005706 [Naganishia friedmannii]|uniref:Uncharacterized protein n=1 Tax=Naganishia friedmannii TaxID=89922 RepID=A0ACC2V8V2_9TREE|nr:hypothetical protein QFC21_005706 [Naganishia friedmannii]